VPRASEKHVFADADERVRGQKHKKVREVTRKRDNRRAAEVGRGACEMRTVTKTTIGIEKSALRCERRK
jgi:hypothetical protein